MKKDKPLIEKLKNRYKLVIYNESSLKEVTSFYLSRLNVFAFFGLFVIIISVIVSLLFVFTPLNAFLPTYTDSRLKKEIVETVMRADSIEKVLVSREKYFDNMRNILTGNEFETYSEEEEEKDTASINREQIDFTKTKHDSILRILIEEEEQMNLAVIQKNAEKDLLKNLHFFMPAKGMITNEFDASIGHFGIDIVANPDEPVMATLAGTVILATWSLATGYVIQIQHDGNLISIYKHNSVLLKKVGDHVEAGESIAIMGNTGEATTGPHLHFELWHNGSPINPEDHIAF